MDLILKKIILEELESKANQDNPAAQSCLGFLYEGELGFEGNYDKSFLWYEKAAEQGVIFAQHNLGNLYRLGKGVGIDINISAEWYLKAAEQGDPDAQYCLFNYFTNQKARSDNIEERQKNREIGANWCKKAAEQGYVSAQLTLAYLYKEGIGVKKNLKMSSEWEEKNSKVEAGMIPNTWLVDSGLCMTGGFIYHKNASDLKNYILSQSDDDIRTCFEYLYSKNTENEQNNTKLFMLCNSLAKQGKSLVQTELGYMYFCAKGCEYNLSEVFKWWNLAAENGETISQFFLSLMYKNGDGVKKDERKARDYWEKTKNILSDSEICYYSEKYYKKD